jgi:hypothetical protein
MVIDDIDEWAEIIEAVDLELPDIPLEEKLKDEYFHRDDN